MSVVSLVKARSDPYNRMPRAVHCGITVFTLHTCRPGAYAHSVAHNRHTEFDESFGGRRNLKNTVTVKCTKGVPDEVSVTLLTKSVCAEHERLLRSCVL